MNLDEKFIFVFIRQNMFQDHQMVHNFHLGFLMGRAVEGYCQKRHTVTGHPSVALIGRQNAEAFAEVIGDLKRLGVEYLEWIDPDSQLGHDDFGLTGIVTEPISNSVRNKLSKYRPWKEIDNVHPKEVVN